MLVECDIRECVEVFQGGSWRPVKSTDKRMLAFVDTDTPCLHGDFEATASGEFFAPVFARNYPLFAALAGVRNVFGIAPIQVWLDTPPARRKDFDIWDEHRYRTCCSGWPDDVSDLVHCWGASLEGGLFWAHHYSLLAFHEAIESGYNDYVVSATSTRVGDLVNNLDAVVRPLEAIADYLAESDASKVRYLFFFDKQVMRGGER